MGLEQILIIANPTAGRRRGSSLRVAEEALTQAGVPYSLYLTTGPGDATVAARQASRQGYRLVVAAGGDGSINEVVNGLLGTDVELGILPIGTENVLARELGIPRDPTEACHYFLTTTAQKVDVGWTGERAFLAFAGVGFDAYVAHRLDVKCKARWGALAYFWASLRLFYAYRRQCHQVVLQVEDQEFEVDFWMLLVGNIARYGGGLRPAPRARIDDGLLDLCIFPSAGLVGTLNQLWRTRRGQHISLPGVIYLQAQSFRLDVKSLEQVQLDGEAWNPRVPLNFEVLPNALSLRYQRPTLRGAQDEGLVWKS